MTRSEAMRKAGYSEASIKNPHQNLSKKRGYREALEEQLIALHNAGITPEFLAEAVNEILHAEKTIVIPMAAAKKLQEKYPDRELRPIKGPKRIVVPDWDTRVKAVEIVINLLEEWSKAVACRFLTTSR